jgi:hypothetical protein
MMELIFITVSNVPARAVFGTTPISANNLAALAFEIEVLNN